MGSAETQMKGGSLSGIMVKWCKNDGKQSMTFGLSIFMIKQVKIIIYCTFTGNEPRALYLSFHLILIKSFEI